MDKRLPIAEWLKLKLYKNVRFNPDQDDYERDEPDRIETTDLSDAQVVSSEVREGILPTDVGKHMLAIDLDAPAHLIPSSTDGHYHLYVEVLMDWDRYENLLRALAEAGVIEYGYAQVSIKRKATHLRLPWVKKGYPAPLANAGSDFHDRIEGQCA